MKGTVKWFDEEKGYGFIKPEDNGKDIFVHRSGIETRNTIYGQEKTVVREGDSVEFETKPGDKGPVAINVRQV